MWKAISDLRGQADEAATRQERFETQMAQQLAATRQGLEAAMSTLVATIAQFSTQLTALQSSFNAQQAATNSSAVMGCPAEFFQLAVPAPALAVPESPTSVPEPTAAPAALQPV